MPMENDRKIINGINHKIPSVRRGLIIGIFMVFIFLKEFIALFVACLQISFDHEFMNIFFAWHYVIIAPTLVLVLFVEHDPRRYSHPINGILLGVFTVVAGLWIFFEGKPVIMDYYQYSKGYKSIKTVTVENYKFDSMMPSKLTVLGDDKGYNIPFMLPGAVMQGEDIRIVYLEKSRMVIGVLPAPEKKTK
jgi:hypothetical protein